MPAPSFEAIVSGEAVIVATNVTAGQIRKVKPGSPGSVYSYTFVPTGGDVPEQSDFRGGRIFMDSASFIFGPFQSAIDVYIWLTGTEDGEVRVET